MKQSSAQVQAATKQKLQLMLGHRYFSNLYDTQKMTRTNIWQHMVVIHLATAGNFVLNLLNWMDVVYAK